MTLIKQVEHHLLQPAALQLPHLESVLGRVLRTQIDAADLYFQASWHESWSLEDGKVKDGSYHADRGVGVRVMSGEKTGFSYANDIDLSALESAATSACQIARAGQAGTLPVWRQQLPTPLYPSNNPLDSLSTTDKIAWLEQVDREAHALDPRVQQVMASLSGSYEMVLVLAADGTYAADIRPLVRFDVRVIVASGEKRESGFSGGGGRGDYQVLTAEARQRYTQDAVRQALVNLDARPAPAGVMPVVLGCGWPGVLLHEAVGHGLEGDFNRKKSSAFHDRVGQRVAAPNVTVVDDATMPGRRGSLTIDDEGVAAQCTTLIENGILKGFMQDKQNARLMGQASTGNGRRESFAHLPMPRMTNTYMLPGAYEPEEIIASVKDGIYAVNFAGGQVDITSGKFVFSASEAYKIENGKVTYPIKGATLIGNGPDVLNKVSLVGNNLELDSGIGVCGKDGQSVPVGVGMPTIRIDELTVGGTAI
ncbi:MAG: protease TldD [marine bacterium B5-7]|nr:MAG: protease TldD [marine bacterium B5-7]